MLLGSCEFYLCFEPCVMFFSLLKQADLGIRTYFFIIPHWASMSHVLGTNRGNIVVQSLFIHNYWIK